MAAPTGTAAPEQILRDTFGFDSLRPGQDDIVEAILAGRDTLAIMPTGGGKSLCYQLPALCREGVTIVVSPLIALMKDQVDALLAKGIPAAAINSSLGGEEYRQVMNDFGAEHCAWCMWPRSASAMTTLCACCKVCPFPCWQ